MALPGTEEKMGVFQGGAAQTKNQRSDRQSELKKKNSLHLLQVC